MVNSELVKQIHNEMLQEVDDRYDVSIGSFYYDGLQPVATQYAKRDAENSQIVNKVFPQFSTGIFLELWAEAHGVKKKLGEKAKSELPYEFYCETGTLIPRNTPVFPQTDPTLIFYTVTDAVSENGIAKTIIEAGDVGTRYNLPANTIQTLGISIPGITSCTNPSDTKGGANIESDDELRKRVLDKMANSNLGGADRDYERWAREVEGIYGCKVIPEWQGFGTNSVKLIVYGENGLPLDSVVVQNVVDYIVSPTDRTKRLCPMNADVTIITSTSVVLDIEISNLVTKSGYLLGDVQERIRNNLLPFVNQIKPSEIVKVKELESVITTTAGVYDFDSLTVNGSYQNIPTTDEQKARLGVITYVN